jgi:hypothetical protein
MRETERGEGEVVVDDAVVEEFSDTVAEIVSEDAEGEMLLSRTRPKEAMKGKEKMSWLGEIPTSETRYCCDPSSSGSRNGGEAGT